MLITVKILIFIIVFLVLFFIFLAKFNYKVFIENFKTLFHKIQVFRFMFKVILVLFKRSIVHDFSKFSKHEAKHFANAKKLKDLEYGSIEYKKYIKNTLKIALDHHYANNSHHPEYHKNGINDMSLLDQIEMLCDWKAASLRTKDGDVKKSIEYNQDRFGYNNETKNKYINFLKDINVY